MPEPCRHQHVKYALFLLNLEPLRPIVSPLYSPTMGATAKAPEDMLRSLLAMVLCGVFSIDVWVDMMRSQPFYARISGFDLGLVDNPPPHLRRPRPKRKDTRAQAKDKNKDTAKHHDIINRLATRLVRAGKICKKQGWTFDPAARYRRFEAVLKAIFYTLFVPRSVALGLIDLDYLYTTGDSTKLGTYANPHGKRLCSCPKGTPCRCPRRYQDPRARKASDALGLYHLGYEHWDVTLVIALNARNKGHFTHPQTQLDDQGIPHCPAGQAMYYWGHCPDRQRLKWRCPLKATKGNAAQPCAHAGDCSPSTYGRVVYTYPKNNYRLFTPIPRSSALWDQHYDHHSASERSHKRKKWDYGLRQTRTAGRARIFLRVMLMAMAQHVQAWAATSAQLGEVHPPAVAA